MEIEVAVGYDDNGESIMETLPAKFIVCPECEGHGTILNISMGGHVYTMEEFNEQFDDEDSAEYFRHAGKYDVQCLNCKGKNVVKVIDAEACVTNEQKDIMNAHSAWEHKLWRWDMEDRMTMRGESGIWD